MREQRGSTEKETAEQNSNARPASADRAQVNENPGSVAHILNLQRTLGNSAVARMLEDEPEPVQRSAVHGVLRSPGQPLDEPVQADMEARFGTDFSDVRLHTGAVAQRSADEIGARAYTSGNHIVVGSRGVDRHTLAHELTHVIQQRSGPVAGTDNGDGLRISDPSDRFEREAEQNAKRVMARPHRDWSETETGSPFSGESVQRMPKSTPGPRSDALTNEEWFGTTPEGEVDKQKRFQTHASLIYCPDSGPGVNLLSATNISSSDNDEGVHAEDVLIDGLKKNLDKFRAGPHRYHKIFLSVTKSPCTSEKRDGLPATSKKSQGCTEAIRELATNGIQEGDKVYKFDIVLIVRGLYHGKVKGGKAASLKALRELERHERIEVSMDLSKREMESLDEDG